MSERSADLMGERNSRDSDTAATDQGRGQYADPWAAVFPWLLALVATISGNMWAAVAFLWLGVVFVAVGLLDKWLRRHGR